MTRIGALPTGLGNDRPAASLHSPSKDDDSTARPADIREKAAAIRGQSPGAQAGSTVAILEAQRHVLGRSALLATQGHRRRPDKKRSRQEEGSRRKSGDGTGTAGRLRQLH